MELSLSQMVKSLFHRLDPLTIKKDELIDSQLRLLSLRSGLEYHQAMVHFTECKIKRLTLDIQKDEEDRFNTQRGLELDPSTKFSKYVHFTKVLP